MKKKFIPKFIILLVLGLQLNSCKSVNYVLSINFDNNEIGAYSRENLIEDIGDVNWAEFDDRAEIINDKIRGKVLKVHYPKGVVGPKNGGIQFDKPIEESEEYYLDYYLKFDDNFEFVHGGKLPGLTCGGEKFTGGIHPNNGEGWSARYMWVEEGEIIVYFYHMDMKNKWGDAVRLNTKFKPGQWYRITQYIKVNSEDNFDGKMYVWIDGKRILENENVRYRIAPLGEINSFYFSTFFGGNTYDWAPKKDEAIFFDDIIVSKIKPKKLN